MKHYPLHGVVLTAVAGVVVMAKLEVDVAWGIVVAAVVPMATAVVWMLTAVCVAAACVAEMTLAVSETEAVEAVMVAVQAVLGRQMGLLVGCSSTALPTTEGTVLPPCAPAQHSIDQMMRPIPPRPPAGHV
eukprot:CAMPEP_0202914170 /NCGR_PEP_ID=MMETSP1392-20130828/62427_1 /ASSEMBLY_ACC=CAM_ASM_000868 /TAXON_ID=225041 /ORGANISM="Chlamydomonas chlamydogama, Strain SAG 11-48b" /LENGTH=130 /DNA_ID=CAMNT_0049605715 /DNA_START=231 /DNA_END=620 /DNA_ORIENTATION=+